MLTAPDAVGMDAVAIEAAARLFRAQVDEDRLHPGALLAVYRRGQLVLDLQVGLADTQRGRLMRRDTLAVLFSSTKPLTAVALLQLVERGDVELDAPVARYWREFGAQGKQEVTVRQVLTHRAGIPQLPNTVTWRDWTCWSRMADAIATMVPTYAPGTQVAYHPMVFGWLVGELVRRVDGRDIGRVIREDITLPLGMHDTYVGLPAHELGRVAKLHAMESATRDGCGTVRLFNDPQIQQAIIPAANGISTARDMARFYAALSQGGTLDGARILREETVAMAISPESSAPARDRTLGHSILRGLGFELGGVLPLADRKGQLATQRTFGHGGMGTSICWADAERQLALAFIPNGFREDMRMIKRCRDLSDAVRKACVD